MHEYAQVCAISYLDTILRYKASSAQTQAQLGHATPRQGEVHWTDRVRHANIYTNTDWKLIVLVAVVNPGVCVIVVTLQISSVVAPSVPNTEGVQSAVCYLLEGLLEQQRLQRSLQSLPNILSQHRPPKAHSVLQCTQEVLVCHLDHLQSCSLLHGLDPLVGLCLQTTD